MSHDALIQPIRQWLVDQALGDSDIANLFEELCVRLTGIGLPVSRARLIWQTLHPLFQAETVQWDRGQIARMDHFAHQDKETEAWSLSPMRFMLENRLTVLRRQLTGPNESLDFPVLAELKEEGVTDYLVLATPITDAEYMRKDGKKAQRGIIVTWGTDRESGYSADDLECLQAVQQSLAVACKTVIQARISGNIASTYLGNRAGQNVLNGQIRRGDGTTTNAVVWFSDMRNSTMLAESMPTDEYFAMLNAYFESTAGALVDHGGEVLDFIGDAVLGIFPFENDDSLCDAAKRANATIDDALSRASEANAERAKNGGERFKFGIGLNIGELKFGNIGIPERLSFSVIGHTVNEVSRIESMTKLLQQPVLAGGNLASLAPERWKSLGEHKLEGVLDPLELFAFKAAA